MYNPEIQMFGVFSELLSNELGKKNQLNSYFFKNCKIRSCRHQAKLITLLDTTEKTFADEWRKRMSKPSTGMTEDITLSLK